MQHLDEGLLMALLDGELSGGEQQEVEIHLRSCAECSARLVDLKSVMAEADDLVNDLGQPPVIATPATPARTKPAGWMSPRNLAWAASIVAALGLGYWGSQMRTAPSTDDFANLDAERSTAAPATEAAPPAAPQATVLQQEAPSTAQPSAGAGGPVMTARAQVDEEADNQRANVGEADQAAGASRDLANSGVAAELGVTAERRDTTPRPAEVAAKLGDAARQRSAEGERRMAPAAAAPARTGLRLEASAAPYFQRVTMEDAVRQLSGAIRLIDGLTPEQFEVAAGDSAQPVVRVLYRVGPGEFRLFLEQRRVDNSFVASDLQAQGQALDAVTTVNKLSWNDLRGFSLTLSGPFSVDSLFHFKTLVK